MKYLIIFTITFLPLISYCQVAPIAKIIDKDQHYDLIDFYLEIKNSKLQSKIQTFLSNEDFNIYKTLYQNGECTITEKDFIRWRKTHNAHTTSLLYSITLKQNDNKFYIIYYTMSNDKYSAKIPVMFREQSGEIYLTNAVEAQKTFALKATLALVNPQIFEDYKIKKSSSTFTKYTSQIVGVSTPFIDVNFVQKNYPKKYDTTLQDYDHWNIIYDQINKFNVQFSFPNTIDLFEFSLSESEKSIINNAAKAGQVDVINHVLRKHTDELKSIELMNKLNDHFTNEIYKASIK